MDHIHILNTWQYFLFSESSSVCYNLHLHHRRHSGRVSGTKNCLLHRQPHLPRQLSVCHLCSQHAPSLLCPGDYFCICDSIKLTGAWWSCPGYCVFSMWGKRKSYLFNHATTKAISNQIYISEVTTPAWRMTLNSGISSFVTLGMVIVFTLGKVRQWSWEGDEK